MTDAIEQTGDALAQRLAEKEAQIKLGLEGAAAALREIKKDRLYKATHSAWNDYCSKVLGMSGSRADQIIRGGELANMFATLDAPAPVNDRQARELAPLDGRPEAMEQAMLAAHAAAAKAGKAISHEHIRNAVAEITSDGETVVEVDGEGIVLPNPDLVPTPEVPPIVKPDLGDGVSHPARYSAAILERFEQVINQVCNVAAPTVKVLDPFAGTGRIHELPFDTTGVEIEPEWGKVVHGRVVVADARSMPFADGEFDVVATSPTYGNRLADKHNASDPERRRSYTHDLGRPLTEGNTGGLQWGHEYQEAHVAIWTEVRRVMKSGAWLLLNIKDHIRNGEQQPVSHWHTAALVELGFTFWPGYSAGVATQHLRQGSNTEQRAGQELVLVFRKV